MRFLVGGLLFVGVFNGPAIVGFYFYWGGIWVLHVLLSFKQTARGGHFSHCRWVAETLAKI
jgi:hypothetical protein